jgi:hypothetical protein
MWQQEEAVDFLKLAEDLNLCQDNPEQSVDMLKNINRYAG